MKNSSSPRFGTWRLLGWAALAFAGEARAALVSATDVNPNPNIFEAHFTAVQQNVNIGGTTVRALVYKDDPPAPFVSAGAGIPGPEIKVKVGDLVIVHLKNNLPDDSVSVHWHGIELDGDSDGTAVTQDAVLPGQSYTYRFMTFRPGLFWYHPHMLPGSTTFAGMYGSIVVESAVEQSLKGGVLPTDANTHSLVLSDIEFDAAGNVGLPFNGAIVPINELVVLCILDAEGEPGGSRQACGVVFPGKTVLVNGQTPNAGAQTPKFTVASGQRIRLRLFNAAITRHFRLKLLGSGDNKLYRIGGEGGLLDRVQLDGGVKGSWDTRHDLGEVVMGSGERADVIVVPTGNQGDIIQLVGNPTEGKFKLSAGLPANYPLAFFQISGTSSDVAPQVGDPILAGTAEDVENIKTAGSLASLVSPAPFAGSSDPVIRLTNARPNGVVPMPSIDGFSAMLDTNLGNGDVQLMPRPPTSRYAKLGDLLELSVRNETDAVHPFHLHGFSMQPVRVVDNATNATLYSFNYDEFIDSIDVYDGQTLVFRVRLDDRPKFRDHASGPPGPVIPPSLDAPSGGGVGRWLFHCHIFHHAGLGMMGELAVLPDTTPTVFDFVDVTNVLRSTPQVSNSIVVGGINFDAPISVTGGEYAINGGAFTSAPGFVLPGASVRVRHTSSPAFSTTVTTTLTIGGVAGAFSSTTLVEDLVPNPFHFNDRGLALPLFHYVSNSVTITGINSTPPISLTGGSDAAYSVNGGPWRTAPGTVQNGDTVRLRNRIPALDLLGRPLSVSARLTVGGVSDTWTLSTLP